MCWTAYTCNADANGGNCGQFRIFVFMAGTCEYHLGMACCGVDHEHRLQKVFRKFFAVAIHGNERYTRIFWHGPAEAVLDSVYITYGENQLDQLFQAAYHLGWVKNNAIGNLVEGR